MYVQIRSKTYVIVHQNTGKLKSHVGTLPIDFALYLTPELRNPTCTQLSLVDSLHLPTSLFYATR